MSPAQICLIFLTVNLRAYAQYCKTTLRNVEFAIIAPNDLTFGIARMFEMLSELENIYVTREVDDALAWLEVTLPENY